MKEKVFIIVLGLVVALALSLGYNYKLYRDLQEQPVKTVTKTVTKYVEKKDSMPEPKTEIVIRTVKVPVPSKADADSLLDNNFAGTLQPVDSLELEITQKVYSDSTYTAYVSGYEANLDSIFVRQKQTITTVLETRTVTNKKFRKLNIGLTGGYGYGFTSKTFEPFVGVGITWCPF